MESVAALPWNGWPDWRGISGQFAVESVAAFAWNWWPLCRGIRSKAMTLDQQRIQELEARIERLEREKSILKKATALLMSEGIERTR